MEEEKNRVTEWISGHKKWIAVCCIAAAAVAAAVFLVIRLRQYTSYETVSSFEHVRESNDSYVKFGGKIVQYGGDGITCLDTDGSSIWSKSYEMEQPLVSVTDHYLAAVDQGGSEIYLFDASGFLSGIETPYPVRQIVLADNGSVAVVLEESEACRIVLYDSDGEIIVEGQAHLDDSGYPAAIALSGDGTMLAVSYLTVSSGELSSVLTFYDFTGTESGTASASAEYRYEGEAIVRLAVLDGTFAAFSDAAVRIYGGSGSLKKEIELTEEISSIVIGEDRFAVVYEADEEETAAYVEETEETESISGDAAAETTSAVRAYAADLYGKNGGRICHTVFGSDYQSLSFLQNGSLAALGTDTCTIITAMGRVRFSCDFAETICDVFSNGISGYTFIFADRIENVQLK